MSPSIALAYGSSSDERVALGQLEAGLGAVGVEQAQLDLVRHLGEEGEVGAGAVVRRAEGVRRAGPDALGRAHAPASVCAAETVPTGSA